MLIHAYYITFFCPNVLWFVASQWSRAIIILWKVHRKIFLKRILNINNTAFAQWSHQWKWNYHMLFYNYAVNSGTRKCVIFFLEKPISFERLMRSGACPSYVCKDPDWNQDSWPTVPHLYMKLIWVCVT